MKRKPTHDLLARVLITRGDQVLIIRRAKNQDRAGFWEIPGGHVDDGESLEKAALRELKEETNIALEQISFLFTSSYLYENQQRLSGFFVAEIDEKRTKDIQLSKEHDQYAWINAVNYHNKKLDDFYLEFFKNFFETDLDDKAKVVVAENNTTKDIKVLQIYTDGGSRGNPGPSASGYVIMTEDDQLIEEGGEYLGITTNNQAEYQAVKLALERAVKYQPHEIHFFIDALLVVNQMKGVFKVKNRDLWPIHQDIKDLSKKFKKVTYTHVRREFNTLADDKVNEVLNSRAKK